MIKLKVGDIITHKYWYGDSYEVVGIYSIFDNAYYLKSCTTGENLVHPWVNSLKDLIVNDIIPTPKSAVERKIAFMRERFENRHTEKCDEPAEAW